MGRLGYRTVENSNDLIKYKESLKNLPEINGTDYVQSDWKFVGIIGLNLQGETKKKYRYFF